MRILISISEREGILSAEPCSLWIVVLSTVFMCGLIYPQDKLQPANACLPPEFTERPKRWGLYGWICCATSYLHAVNMIMIADHLIMSIGSTYHLFVQPRAKPSSELTYLARC